MKTFARNVCYALVLLLLVLWMKRGEISFARHVSAYVSYVVHTDLDPQPLVDELLRFWQSMRLPFAK